MHQSGAMIITSFDLLLLVTVPAAIAMLETVLWRLAVRRVQPRLTTGAAPDAASPARNRRPAPVRVLANAGGDRGSISQRSRR